MIGKRYKAHKDNVIDIFKGYAEKRGDINDGVDLQFLQRQIEALQSGKYRLAIAGEVKAGKSTFINALLGTELLPADVLQASSAIVEIFKSEKSFLKVKYADGHEEEVYDDLETSDIDEAKERLHKICSLSDEFRAIPTTLIDDCIVESTDHLEVTKEFIMYLEEKSRLKHLDRKKELLQQYIANRPKDKIPTEINFGFPLKWDFDELRIVDSPGVNAVGGVQDVAFGFFEMANAILFIHPIKPVESESFRTFVESVISNRSKDTLFLVLTHAGLYADSDVERLYGEAIQLYDEIIPQERILVVDSLLKLIHCDLENGKSIVDIETSSSQKENILANFEKKALISNRPLQDILLEYSGFDKLFQAIDTFSMSAPYIQLREILEKIKDGYREQECQYGDQINLLEQKKRNPQEFENEIERIQASLNEYRLLLANTKEDITTLFSGTHAEWAKQVDTLKRKNVKLITDSYSQDDIRKRTVDAFDEVDGLIKKYSNDLTNLVRQRLEKIDKEFSPTHKITLPKVDLSSIEEKSKKSACRTENDYKTESIWENWNWLKFKWGKNSRTSVVGTKSVYDESKYLEAYKNEINKEFYKVTDNLPKMLEEIRKVYLDTFVQKMNTTIDERKDALKKEKEKEQTNAEIVAEIEMLEAKKKLLIPEIKRAEEILEDIK